MSLCDRRSKIAFFLVDRRGIELPGPSALLTSPPANPAAAGPSPSSWGSLTSHTSTLTVSVLEYSSRFLRSPAPRSSGGRSPCGTLRLVSITYVPLIESFSRLTQTKFEGGTLGRVARVVIGGLAGRVDEEAVASGG